MKLYCNSYLLHKEFHKDSKKSCGTACQCKNKLKATQGSMFNEQKVCCEHCNSLVAIINFGAGTYGA